MLKGEGGNFMCVEMAVGGEKHIYAAKTESDVIVTLSAIMSDLMDAHADPMKGRSTVVSIVKKVFMVNDDKAESVVTVIAAVVIREKTGAMMMNRDDFVRETTKAFGAPPEEEVLAALYNE